MSSSLDVEIARRLGSDPAVIEATLEAVIDRVRQQVGHYGYARLAGIGTFRQHQGRLTFEPDRTLAEVVNHRFAGLEALPVEGSYTPEPDQPEAPEPDELDAPEPDAAPEPGPSAPEPTVSFDPSFDREEDEPAPYGHRVDPFADEEAEDVDEGTVWAEDEPEGEDHPLGPYPPPSYEDAPFLVVGDEPDEPWRPPADEPDADPFADLPGHDEPDEPEETFPDAGVGAVAPEPTIRWDLPEDVEPTLPPVDAPDSVPAFDDPPPAVPPDDAYAPPPFDEAWQEDDDRTGPFDEAWQEDDDRTGPYEETQPDAFAPEPPEAALEDEGDEAFDEAYATPPAEPVPAAVPEAAPASGRSSGKLPPRHRVQHGPNRVAQEQDRNYVPWIVAGVLVLAVGAAAFWFLTRPVPLAETERVNQTPVAAPDTQAAVAAVDTTVGAVPADTVAEPPPPEPVASTPLYSAEGFDRAAGGYTVVVASETSEAGARTAAERWRARGFRTGIVVGRSGGVTRYRVGVGQFRTLAEADSVRSRLAGDEFPNDAWVTGID